MRNARSLMATLSLSLSLPLALAACATDATPDEDHSTAAQALGVPVACFADLGQPIPSNPLSRRFDSGCSTPSTGASITYRTWAYGDGTFSIPGSTVTDHIYPTTNTCYKVTLTVYDSSGQDASTSRYASFCTAGPCNPVCPP